MFESEDYSKIETQEFLEFILDTNHSLGIPDSTKIEWLLHVQEFAHKTANIDLYEDTSKFFNHIIGTYKFITFNEDTLPVFKDLPKRHSDYLRFNNDLYVFAEVLYGYAKFHSSIGNTDKVLQILNGIKHAIQKVDLASLDFEQEIYTEDDISLDLQKNFSRFRETVLSSLNLILTKTLHLALDYYLTSNELEAFENLRQEYSISYRSLQTNATKKLCKILLSKQKYTEFSKIKSQLLADSKLESTSAGFNVVEQKLKLEQIEILEIKHYHNIRKPDKVLQLLSQSSIEPVSQVYLVIDFIKNIEDKSQKDIYVEWFNEFVTNEINLEEIPYLIARFAGKNPEVYDFFKRHLDTHLNRFLNTVMQNESFESLAELFKTYIFAGEIGKAQQIFNTLKSNNRLDEIQKNFIDLYYYQALILFDGSYLKSLLENTDVFGMLNETYIADIAKDLIKAGKTDELYDILIHYFENSSNRVLTYSARQEIFYFINSAFKSYRDKVKLTRLFKSLPPELKIDMILSFNAA